MTFQLGLDIAAPAGKVFAFVADFSTMPKWYSAVKRVQRVDGIGGLGTRYKVHRDLPGGPALNEVSIARYSEGDEVVFTSLSGPTPFTYRYLVRPFGDTTRLLLEGTISAAGLTGPAALLGPLAERLFKSGMRDNLGTLKQLLEE